MTEQTRTFQTRLLETAAKVGDSRAVQFVLGAQPFIYADFVRRGIAEGMPWWSAITHPITTWAGGADAMFSNPENLRQLMFTLELGELKTVGLLTGVTVGAAIWKHYESALRGELPIDDHNGIIFLSIGDAMPIANSYGRQISQNKGEISNLYFSALYGQEQSQPPRPEGFNKRHYTQIVDLSMDAANTDILRNAGALSAQTVILSGNDRETLEQVALTVYKGNKHEGQPVRIIPIATHPQHFKPYSVFDIGLNEVVQITEAPINPYAELAEVIIGLTSDDLDERTLSVTTFSQGHFKGDIQQQRIDTVGQRVDQFGNKPLTIFLNGGEGDEKKALNMAFGSQITQTLQGADIVISYGDGALNDDNSVAKSAKKINQQIPENALHVSLVFSEGNSDSVGFHTHGVVSIQHLIAKELTERTTGEVRFKQSYIDKLRSRRSRIQNGV
ncbi:hypothetical protein KC726_01395 [Candidatus Woesebacteria bacterium]|nr:hypothetical protein [Candidatus Woesebacteria bacterium]